MMVTRRGFIQGVLAGIVVLVLPKAAEAMPFDEPVVGPEHGIAIDGKDSYVWPDISPGDRMYYGGYVFSDDRTLYSPTIFMNGNCIVDDDSLG